MACYKNYHFNVIFGQVQLQAVASHPLRSALPSNRSAPVVFVHTCVLSIKIARVKAGLLLLFLPVVISKWELLYMGFPEWLHHWPTTTSRSCRTRWLRSRFIVSPFSCIPVQPPRTVQSAGSSAEEQHVAAYRFTVNTGRWSIYKKPRPTSSSPPLRD